MPRGYPLRVIDLDAIRKDFPALQRVRNGKPPIYLNSTCMSLRPRPVIDAITSYYAEYPTCGGGRLDARAQGLNWFQGELHERERAAREAVASLLGAAGSDEIVWTRNTTEAINIVAHGLRFEPGDEIVGSERGAQLEPRALA